MMVKGLIGAVRTDFEKRNLCRIDVGLAGMTSEQLKVARNETAGQRVSLRQNIFKLVFPSEQDLLTAATKGGMQFLNVTADSIEQPALETVSAEIALYYNIVPLKITENPSGWPRFAGCPGSRRRSGFGHAPACKGPKPRLGVQ